MKRIGFAHLFALTTTLVLGLQTAANSHADEAPIYKIEVVVFERLSAQDSSPTRERWPRDIQLGFPANTVSLAEQPAEESGGNAFRLLPSGDWSLTREKNALARNAQLRPLFHQAWLQPLTTEGQAPAVRLSGGDNYEGHWELDGTITLSLSRFVQLQSNLWLAKFTPNQGQPPELWPPLPTLDTADMVEMTEVAEMAENNGLTADEQQPPEPQSLEQQPEDWSTPLPEPPVTNFIDGRVEAGLAEGMETEGAEVRNDSAFLVRQIVTLNQSRRMRSGEVHYLDHPRFGMLIQVRSHKAAASP